MLSATAGPKTEMNSASASLPGMLGAASWTSWPSEESSSAAWCMPRTHSGSTSTSSGLAAVIAIRRRPGSRRTEVE